MKKKIIILCDHAKRDFVGNILLANELLNHEYIVYIVPIFEIEYQILKINPDSIILCYARKNNENLINLLGFLGIKTYVCETEGIPYDMSEFARQISGEKIYKKVNKYFLWGEYQYKKIISAVKDVEKFKVVGCIRYDNLLRNKKLVEGNNYLINTNFTVANPKFTKNKKEELRNRAAFGTGKDHINTINTYSDTVFAGALRAFESLVSENKEYKFILRPHPFESENSYKYLEKYPNFKLSEELTSIEEIEKSKAIIHINCQTAIESVILGRPAYSLSWLYKNEMGNPLSREISIKVDSIKELNDYLRKNKISEENPASMKIIKDYISSIFSGDSCSKIAKSIKEDNERIDVSEIDNLMAFFYLLKLIIKMLIGKKMIQKIIRKKNSFDKYFTYKDIIKCKEIKKEVKYSIKYSKISKDKIICLKMTME